ncbi:hypothetical protein ES703_120407 [subsurface metagenome]
MRGQNNSFNKYLIIFLVFLITGCSGGSIKTSEDETGDTTPPEVVTVYSTAYNKVRIEFSEEVDTTTCN